MRITLALCDVTRAHWQMLLHWLAVQHSRPGISTAALSSLTYEKKSRKLAADDVTVTSSHTFHHLCRVFLFFFTCASGRLNTSWLATDATRQKRLHLVVLMCMAVAGAAASRSLLQWTAELRANRRCVAFPSVTGESNWRSHFCFSVVYRNSSEILSAPLLSETPCFTWLRNLLTQIPRLSESGVSLSSPQWSLLLLYPLLRQAGGGWDSDFLPLSLEEFPEVWVWRKSLSLPTASAAAAAALQTLKWAPASNDALPTTPSLSSFRCFHSFASVPLANRQPEREGRSSFFPLLLRLTDWQRELSTNCVDEWRSVGVRVVSVQVHVSV